MFGFYIIVSTVLLTKASWALNEDEINAREFQAMCAFLRLLKEKPPLPKVEIGDQVLNTIEAAREIENRISLLNASTTDEPTFSQLQKAIPYDQAQSNPIVKQLTQKEWENLLEVWKKIQGSSESSQAQIRRPPNTESRKVAHEKIGKVLATAKGFVGQLAIIKSKIEENNREARKNMLSAIYGTKTIDNLLAATPQTSEDIHTKLDTAAPTADAFGAGGTSSYSAACEGQHSGTSIISDIACLCTLSTVATEPICGSGVTGLKTTPSSTAAWGSTTGNLAQNVEAACMKPGSKTEKAEEPTPETLQQIILEHRGMLGTNTLVASGSAPTQASHAKGYQFMLGVHILAQGTLTCDGGAIGGLTANKGACVNYAHHLGKGDEIPWILNVTKAIANLKKSERYETQEHTLLARLEQLAHSAELYYESAFQGNPKTLHVGTQGREGNSSDGSTASAAAINPEKSSATSVATLKYGGPFILAVIIRLHTY